LAQGFFKAKGFYSEFRVLSTYEIFIFHSMILFFFFSWCSTIFRDCVLSKMEPK